LRERAPSAFATFASFCSKPLCLLLSRYSDHQADEKWLLSEAENGNDKTEKAFLNKKEAKVAKFQTP
jgi:hypothetical protein